MLVVAACVLLDSMAVAGQSVLSRAQEAAISKAVAGASAGDKALIAGWSDGKKLAEFFCKRLGLMVIAKQQVGADRLFLGPDDEGVRRFKVEGNRRVAGDGTVRVGAEWKDLTFECVIDPDKALAISFVYKIK